MSMASPVPVRFSFHNTTTTAIYTLSLHDALPIFNKMRILAVILTTMAMNTLGACSHYVQKSFDSKEWKMGTPSSIPRSEEHTSELQSPYELVCRLLLEKKKTNRPRPARPERTYTR